MNKKENIEEIQEIDVDENGLTEEDKVISLEGITGLEKRFLNLVRRFRSQKWLLEQLTDLFSEVVDTMMDKTVEDQALRETIEEFHSNQLDLDSIYLRFGSKIEEVTDREEFIENALQFWITNIGDTIEGELAPTEE